MIDQGKTINQKSLKMLGEAESLIIFKASVFNKITNKKLQD